MRQGQDSGSFSYTPNELNQYNPGKSQPVSHGAEHEVSNYESVSYQYLGDTHLSRVTLGTNVYELGYDALGRCVRRTQNKVSSYYIYDGERPILEYNPGAITARNIYGSGVDGILARDAGALFYHQDRLGNVSAVSDGLGKVVEQ